MRYVGRLKDIKRTKKELSVSFPYFFIVIVHSSILVAQFINKHDEYPFYPVPSSCFYPVNKVSPSKTRSAFVQDSKECLINRLIILFLLIAVKNKSKD
jgi:hypothetical protein